MASSVRGKCVKDQDKFSPSNKSVRDSDCAGTGRVNCGMAGERDGQGGLHSASKRRGPVQASGYSKRIPTERQHDARRRAHTGRSKSPRQPRDLRGYAMRPRELAERRRFDFRVVSEMRNSVFDFQAYRTPSDLERDRSRITRVEDATAASKYKMTLRIPTLIGPGKLCRETL